MSFQHKPFVFFGSLKFELSSVVLEGLVEAGWKPALIVANPYRASSKDEPMPPLQVLAKKHDIPTFQPEDVKAPEARDRLSHIDAEFAIVAAYPRIIPKNILDLFSLGVIGVHPSLLPKYRGPSPVRSAILAGEEETGTTLYIMDEKMDHGEILATREFPNPNDKIQMTNVTYKKLHDKLAHLSGELLVETLPIYLAGNLEPQPQDHDAATYTKMLTTEDGFVPQEEIFIALRGEGDAAEEIDRKIRALGVEPGAWTVLANRKSQMANRSGQRVKLLEAHLEGEKLVLDTVQVAGKKPQPANQIPGLKKLSSC